MKPAIGYYSYTRPLGASKKNIRNIANLSKIENGKRDFDKKKIDLLCAVFRLDKSFIENELISEKIVKEGVKL